MTDQVYAGKSRKKLYLAIAVIIAAIIAAYFYFGGESGSDTPAAALSDRAASTAPSRDGHGSDSRSEPK